MKRVCVVSSIIGSFGDAVNETQIVLALARQVDEIFAISPVGLRTLFSLSKYRASVPINVHLIPIPTPIINFYGLNFLNIFLYSIYSILITLIIYIIDKILNCNFIYIRNPIYAFILLTNKKIRNKIFVKIPAIIEDEISSSKVGKKLIGKFFEIIDRYVISASRLIIVPHVEFLKMFIKRRKIVPKMIFILPAGISERTISFVNTFCRRKIKSSNEVVLGYMGLLAPWYNVEILCDVAYELKKKGISAKLYIIGDGPRKKYVEERCKKLNVEFKITGPLSHIDTLCTARCKFDVLLVPGIKSTNNSIILPIKVLESIALGIPVIITNMPKTNLLEECKSLIFSSLSVQTLVDNIIKYLQSPSSENVCKTIKNYTYEKMITDFLNTVYKIMST